ncbi:hypothetical protein OHB00_32000 [Streptomyces sp. NBC_00631]
MAAQAWRRGEADPLGRLDVGQTAVLAQVKQNVRSMASSGKLTGLPGILRVESHLTMKKIKTED